MGGKRTIPAYLPQRYHRPQKLSKIEEVLRLLKVLRYFGWKTSFKIYFGFQEDKKKTELKKDKLLLEITILLCKVKFV